MVKNIVIPFSTRDLYAKLLISFLYIYVNVKTTSTYSSSGCDIFPVIIIGSNCDVTFQTRPGTLVSQRNVLEAIDVFPLFQINPSVRYHVPRNRGEEHDTEHFLWRVREPRKRIRNHTKFAGCDRNEKKLSKRHLSPLSSTESSLSSPLNL